MARQRSAGIETTSTRALFQRSGRCADFAGGFDSFKYAEVHNEPR